MRDSREDRVKIQMHVMNKDCTNSAMCSREIKGRDFKGYTIIRGETIFLFVVVKSFFLMAKNHNIS